jgi:hypothetical protein
VVSNWFAAGRIITVLVYKIIIKRLAPPFHSDNKNVTFAQQNAKKPPPEPADICVLLAFEEKKKVN